MNKGKRIAAIACTLALAGAIAVPAAFAAGGAGRGFVDSNGDGICDYRGATGTDGTTTSVFGCGRFAHLYGQGNGNYVDANNDGVCDNAGTRQGGNYVDANNDGVCDNIGTGNGACGGNYTDADGDGICDNAGTGQGGSYGNGCGQGRCGRR